MWSGEKDAADYCRRKQKEASGRQSAPRLLSSDDCIDLWLMLHGLCALSHLAGYHCYRHCLQSQSSHAHKALLSSTESSCELRFPCVTLSYSVSWGLTSRGGTVTVQGSLLQVLSVEVVLHCYVVQDGSGLHHLHPIDLYHWHLLEEQGSI